ncbi:unnamed protein product, partial [Rotaria sordida]
RLKLIHTGGDQALLRICKNRHF